jgi:outer membrane protein assembly factor BamB
MKRFALCILLSYAILPAGNAGDWPMWRFDSHRSACSPDELPGELHPIWVRHLPAPIPAWPPDQTSLLFDDSYEPVVVGKTILVPSNVTDSLAAYDTGTGEEKWVFRADGPVRFAPAAGKGKVYLVSDDGYLYCLDAASGSLIWKFRGGPEDRYLLGNQRLVSMWPARGGPVVEDGKVYFAAGIWPFMGVFIHALDAETGKVLWTNSGCGSTYITQPHNSPAFAGLAPQGYLAVSTDRLLVPGSRSVPGGFDTKTGDLLFYDSNCGKGTGGYPVGIGEGWFINHDILFDLAKGEKIEEEGDEEQIDLPVLSGDTLYSVMKGQVVARTAHIGEKEKVDRRGKTEVQKTGWGSPRWEVPAPPGLSQIQIQAGSRLYATGKDGAIAAMQLKAGESPGEWVWQEKVDGKPWRLLAGDGKLFVVTREGTLYAFGDRDTQNPPKTFLTELQPVPGRDVWTEQAESILKETGISEGYALVIGLGTGRLAEELARQSKLQIIAVDPNAKRVDEFRERMAKTGLYGTRVAALIGDPVKVKLPPYLASLIVSEDLEAAGQAAGIDFAKALFAPLRPYGGTVCLNLPSDGAAAFGEWVKQAKLENGAVETKGMWTMLKRPGPLPGSAPWTHQYADSGNSVVSKDQLVKAPLGVLWFGGPSNQAILPRHGHGPSEQVIGGRLFIEGPNLIRAVDVYTGRLLWERPLPGVGAKFDETSHQPGANATGGNYVSTEDGVYVAYGQECVRLDPASGEIIQRFKIPSKAHPDQSEEWGFLNVCGDILISGVSPSEFDSDIDFLANEFKEVDDDEKAELTKWVGEAVGSPVAQDDFGETVKALSKLLGDLLLSGKTPSPEGSASKAEEIRNQIKDYLNSHADISESDLGLKRLNRKLIEAIVPNIHPRPSKAGGWVASGVASKRLVALDRKSGNVLWSQDAERAFIHNGIVAGGGHVFCLDRLPEAVVQALSRRGKTYSDGFSIKAFDAKSGAPQWSVKENIFGTWLGYSEEHDILLQAGRASRDMLPEPDHRLITYRGKDGQIVWDKEIDYGAPCMLHGDTIITQGFALNLLTGERIMREDPLTGVSIPWTFTRNHGCNSAIACENLLTFRSAAAGYYDLARNGGTGNLGGFRSGCTSNLVPADGVLNAPDYTRTCICTYQIQTSLALVSMPEAESWTFNDLPVEKAPIKQVGINLGAPGDRIDEDGVLWLDYPNVGGPSPDVPVHCSPENVRWRRQHASQASGDGLDWVNASVGEGIHELTVKLAEGSEAARKYTVRLFFAEPDTAAPGERVFDVDLQGNRVIDGLDVAKEAGGCQRGIVKECRGIEVKDELKVVLTKASGSMEPILAGVEVKADGW